MFDTIYAFELALTARLHRYWQARRGGDALPSLDAIGPATLPFAVGDNVARALSLIEVVRENGDARFRFASCGSAQTPWHGADMTGRWLIEHPDPQAAARLDWAWRRVLASGAPLHGRRSGRIDGRRREYELLVLPLGSRQGAVTDLLYLQLDIPGPALPRRPALPAPGDEPLRRAA